MTAALVVTGLAHVVTAWALGSAQRTGRLVLAGGGVATLLVAAVPLPSRAEYSAAHTAVATAPFVLLGLWPWFAAREGGARVLSHRVARTSAAVLTASVATLGLGVSGASFGLHEREGERPGADGLGDAGWARDENLGEGEVLPVDRLNGMNVGPRDRIRTPRHLCADRISEFGGEGTRELHSTGRSLRIDPVDRSSSAAFAGGSVDTPTDLIGEPARAGRRVGGDALGIPRAHRPDSRGQ